MREPDPITPIALEAFESEPLAETLRVDEHLEELRRTRDASEASLEESRSSSRWVIATFAVSTVAMVSSVAALVVSVIMR